MHHAFPTKSSIALVLHADAPLSTIMDMESELKAVTLNRQDSSLVIGLSATIVSVAHNLLMTSPFAHFFINVDHHFLLLECLVLIDSMDACMSISISECI